MKWYHSCVAYFISKWCNLKYKIRLMLIKNTYGYRIADKLMTDRLNILNAYYGNRLVSFPFKDLDQTYKHLMVEHLQKYDRSYEHYEHYKSNMSMLRSSLSVFNLDVSVTGGMFLKHEEDFKQFLKAYQRAYIYVMFYNIEHEEDHISTEALECIYYMLDSIRKVYYKEARTTWLLKLEDSMKYD